MSQELLEDYARLLNVNTRACAELFAHDAVFQTRLGTQDLHLCGQREIERFLTHVPRQICFRAGICRLEDDGYHAEIHVLPDGLPATRRRVRYRVESGRFTRFHWLDCT
jgi:hypothetical protein